MSDFEQKYYDGHESEEKIEIEKHITIERDDHHYIKHKDETVEINFGPVPIKPSKSDEEKINNAENPSTDTKKEAKKSRPRFVKKNKKKI